MTESDMNLNNTKETEIRRNARWLLRLTALEFRGMKNPINCGNARSDLPQY